MGLNYRDLRALPTLFGYPEAVMLDDDMLVVSDWTGCCRAVSLTSGDAMASPAFSILGGGAGATLRSLRVDPGNRSRCVAATTATWAAIWQLGAEELLRVDSLKAAVYAAEFSPDGSQLMLGVGGPQLTEAAVQAAVEFWAVGEDEPRHIATVAVPGVGVEWLGWDHRRDRLIVLSGRRNQDASYVTQLDGNNLRAIRINEVNPCVVRQCRLSASKGALLVLWSEGLELRLLEAISMPEWQCSSGAGLHDFCVDDEQGLVLTTQGEFLDIDSGECVDRFEVPPKCRAVAVRPSGGVVAVDESGLVRIYDAE